MVATTKRIAGLEFVSIPLSCWQLLVALLFGLGWVASR